MEAMTDFCEDPSARAALAGVSAVFASLGRALVCLDENFRIVHASNLLDELLGPEATQALQGQPIEELLGAELFGPGGAIRTPLLAGERREGWRAVIRDRNQELRPLSVTAAPFTPDQQGICDPRVKYLVVLRPAEEDVAATGSAPMVFAGLIARSDSMVRIFGLIESLASSDATILLTGESGTGKEMIARAIHTHSPRRKGAFVAVNCGGLPGELLESELFGHVRGAFTGAVRDRMGRFELANQGTLFLDEVGDLPLHLQVKLLRVLQERTFERVGESQSHRTDARIIAATNVDLKRAVLEGRFREDLYYRLRVVPIEAPPIRQRREDIEPLARSLLARVAARHGRQVRFSPDVMRMLLRYPWPGNVRELENAIEYAVTVGRGQTLQPEDFPVEVAEGEPQAERSSTDSPPAAAGSAAEELRTVLDAHQWQREETAKALGISRSTLWRKMREYGLIRA